MLLSWDLWKRRNCTLTCCVLHPCCVVTSIVAPRRRARRRGARGGKQRAKTSASSSCNRHGRMSMDSSCQHSTRSDSLAGVLGLGFGRHHSTPFRCPVLISNPGECGYSLDVWCALLRAESHLEVRSRDHPGCRTQRNRNAAPAHTVPYASNTSHTRHGWAQQATCAEKAVAGRPRRQ